MIAICCLFATLALTGCGQIEPKADNENSMALTQITVPPLIDQFVAAVNASDEAAFLSFFDESTGLINDWGRKFVGHSEIKRWSDKEFIGAKGRMTPQRVETDGNTITLWAGWKSEFYSGDSKFVFIVDENKIKEMRIESAK